MKLEYRKDAVICHIGDQEFLELHEGLKNHLEIPELSDNDLRKFMVVIDAPIKKPVPTKFDRALKPFLRGPDSLEEDDATAVADSKKSE